jgi:23S rRNA (adenine2503-C2)-methyltransferase
MRLDSNINLLGMDRHELEQRAMAQGQPAYRGRQIYKSIYARRARNFDEMTDLPRNLRDELLKNCQIAYPEVKGRVASRDGSLRYLLALEDGRTIETVFMPEENRATLCLSSQVGCAVDCRFCFTALLGMQRNLTAGEMAGQVLAVLADRNLPPGFRLNVVFMGMGEPLLNFHPVMKAVRLLADPHGLGISLHRITVSTAGIAPKIAEFGREAVRAKLAISLNASTEEQRTALMPINRKYSLQQLLKACRSYPLRPRERLTFEYVMMEGMNDSDDDAARVAELLGDIRAKVNLIPYNGGSALPYRPPSFARVLAFQGILTDREIPTFIRISRGQDIMAACGQLSLASGAGTLRWRGPEIFQRDISTPGCQ